MKRIIVAMSKYDAEVRADLTDKSQRKMYEHLVLLLLYPKTEYADGWRKEVYAFENSVERLKRTKRFPKEKFIYSCLSECEDVIPQIVAQCKDKMAGTNIIPKHYEYEEIEELIDKYVRWLSYQLSVKGYVTITEVTIELKELGF